MQPRRNVMPVIALALVLALATARSADDLAVLDAECEAAREAKIKPLREAEIAKCKADKRNDPAYCERFWKDYGDAGRTVDGRYRPRLFDDLPECVAAREARQRNTKR